MRVSDKGLAFIAAHEGVVTKAYRDVAGVWTIGVGHTASAGAPAPKAGMTITRAEAFAILGRDVARFEKRVTPAMPGASQHAYDGGVSFDFNTGAIHRASWVKAWRAGTMTAARKALMLWVKAGGRTVRGLVKRREAEARLIFDGVYGDVAIGVAAASARAPSVATAIEDVLAYQKQLAALGYDPGPIDGFDGAKTRAAVLAYQKAHPDLVNDGIVGPATRAQLDRDMAAAPAAIAGGGVAATALAGTVVVAGAAEADGSQTASLVVIGAIGVVAAIVLFVVIRNRVRRARALARARKE